MNVKKLKQSVIKHKSYEEIPRTFCSALVCSENKVADQLCGYHTADLQLCFRKNAKSGHSHDVVHIYLRIEPNQAVVGLSPGGDRHKYMPVMLRSSYLLTNKGYGRHGSDIGSRIKDIVCEPI